MIFCLWVLISSPRADEITAQDKKVIEYLLEQEKVQDNQEGVAIPASSLEKEIQERTKPTSNNVERFPTLGQSWVWGLLFVLLVLGGISWLMPKKKEKIGNLRVQSRSFFGQEGSVAVVEVQDAQNNPRLYLLGLHSKGSPRFLADLSAPIPFPEIDIPKPLIATPSPKPVVQKKNVESTQEKEDLVAQVLRMREQKKVPEPSPQKTTVSTSTKLSSGDPWTEGFNEVFRK